MAPTTYTMRRNDNLWSLVRGYYGSEYPPAIPGSTASAKEAYLIKRNNIADVRKIPTGKVIYLNDGAGSSSSSSSNTKTPPNNVVFTDFGLQCESTSGRDVFASWTWSKIENNFDKFKIRWEWDSPNPSNPSKYITRFEDAETTSPWASFTIPKEFQKTANWVQIFVTPIAKNKTNSKGEDTGVPHWIANKIGKKYNFADNPPSIPDAPVCEIDGETLTMKIDVIKKEIDASYIVFQIVKDNTTAIYKSDKIAVVSVTDDYGKVSHPYAVPLGSSYKVRAKAVGANGKESGWTDFSDEVTTKPSAPSMIIDSCRRVKRTDNQQAAHLEWTAVPNATAYKIEYVNVKTDFENTPANIKSESTEDARTSIEIVVQTIGLDYFFRVRAINDKIQEENGKLSDPSDIVEIPIGSTPAAPTTYSSSDSAFAGETTYQYDANSTKYVDYTPMELNWVHNPTDNSKQTFAELSLKIGDDDWFSYILENTTDVNNTGERIDIASFTYGTSVSYKGNLYFKMDTNHPDFKNKKVQWKVRTAGITDAFSDIDWSTERTIYIYEKPTLGLSMTSDLAGTGGLISTLTGFPFYIRGQLSLTDYTIQKPVGYHLRIVSNDYYVTVDDIGRTKTVNPGDDVYSKYFDTSETLIVEMSANNIDLESSINYTVYCNVDMSTGLTVSNQHEFTVNWIDVEYAINADIAINTEAYTALVTPYCLEKVPAGPGGRNLFNIGNINDYFQVDNLNLRIEEGALIGVSRPYGGSYCYNTATRYQPGTYTFSATFTEHAAERFVIRCYDANDNILTPDDITIPNGTYVSAFEGWISVVSPVTFVIPDTVSYWIVGFGFFYPVEGSLNENDVSITNIQLELGSTATEYEDYYETYEDGGLVENVTLSVYRREYDGRYTEIASGIPNDYTSVTDPHPALDYARYRFVAKDTRTGAISYRDMPAYPVNGYSVILQWEEAWSTFDVGESTATEGPSWTGSLLKLPYNIKVTDKRKREATLVNYAGREHPVSYYGTQLGESSSWSMEIPAEDKETIYALRRLSIWTGDVYVREPSGMGFWANVEVSFNQSYDDVKIPVSLSITRVEGGV